MFERLLNTKICKLQSILYTLHGDNQQDAELIRQLTADSKATKSTANFDQLITLLSN